MTTRILRSLFVSLVLMGGLAILAQAQVTTVQILRLTGTVSINTGFGSGAAFAAGSNIAAWDLNVGTTPGNSGVIDLPTASHGWICHVFDTTTVANVTRQSAYSTTSITVGTAASWTNNDHIYGGCSPF